MDSSRIPYSFEESYPRITRWVKTRGWIEIGEDYRGHFGARALDEGGLVWEGGDPAKTLDETMRMLEDALAEWLNEDSEK